MHPNELATADTAHPRSRGENITSAVKPRPDDGSSPLTRGKQLRGWRREGLDGLIPAHAGKTRVLWKCFVNAGAHPRSRGENSISGLIVDRATGSSPLTRGKPPFPISQERIARLIPAHAGKT